MFKQIFINVTFEVKRLSSRFALYNEQFQFLIGKVFPVYGTPLELTTYESFQFLIGKVFRVRISSFCWMNLSFNSS